MDEPPSKALLLAIFSDNDLIAFFCVIAIALMLILSAFISASEAAFFSLKATDRQRYGSSTIGKERNVAELIKSPHRLLATIVVLGKLTTITVLALSAFLLWQLSGMQTPSALSVGVVSIVSTFVIGIFIVITPKVYSTKSNLDFASSASSFWKVMVNFFNPVSKLIVSFWNRIEDRSLTKRHQNAVEGLNQAFELAAESEEATADEREILKGIANFGALTVRQVMRSRVDISALDIEMNFHQLMDNINKSGFSRMPVYRNTVDKIEGVLYIKDLLPFIEHDENFPWKKLIRPGFFVPENKKIDALLKDFQKKHIHISIVVDEYGGTLGLITLEDIIEEIIGDINDEFDEDGGTFKELDQNTFVFEGKTSLNDFCKSLDIDTKVFDEIKGDSESLGGLILELNSELPSVGKKISFEQFTFVIEAVDKKRVKRVRVHVHEQKES